MKSSDEGNSCKSGPPVVNLVAIDTPVHLLTGEMQRLFTELLDVSNATFDCIDIKMAQQTDKVSKLQKRQIALASTISKHTSAQHHLKQRHSSQQCSSPGSSALNELPGLLNIRAPAEHPDTRDLVDLNVPSVHVPNASGSGSPWTVLGSADTSFLVGVQRSGHVASTGQTSHVQSCAELPQPNALWMPNRQEQVGEGHLVDHASILAPSEAATVFTQCSMMTSTSIRSVRVRPAIKPGAKVPPQLKLPAALPSPPTSLRSDQDRPSSSETMPQFLSGTRVRQSASCIDTTSMPRSRSISSETSHRIRTNSSVPATGHAYKGSSSARTSATSWQYPSRHSSSLFPSLSLTPVDEASSGEHASIHRALMHASNPDANSSSSLGYLSPGLAPLPEVFAHIMRGTDSVKLTPDAINAQQLPPGRESSGTADWHEAALRLHRLGSTDVEGLDISRLGSPEAPSLDTSSDAITERNLARAMEQSSLRASAVTRSNDNQKGADTQAKQVIRRGRSIQSRTFEGRRSALNVHAVPFKAVSQEAVNGAGAGDTVPRDECSGNQRNTNTGRKRTCSNDARAVEQRTHKGLQKQVSAGASSRETNGRSMQGKAAVSDSQQTLSWVESHARPAVSDSCQSQSPTQSDGRTKW